MCRVIRPPVPADDDQRVADLQALDIVLTGPESVLDAVTRELARILDVPAAFISFIDRDTHHYKSAVGLPGEFAETRSEPRELSICSHVVGMNRTLVVEDLLEDERFRDHPVVRESGVRFYAGAPLRADSGRAVGSLCVVDTRPRRLGEREADLLVLVASGVMAQVKLQRATRELLERTLRIERDLEQARQVQRYLLPPVTVEGDGWRIRHLYRPALQLGGDFLDVLRRADGRHAIIVADVAGHGTSAALTATMTKVAFTRAAAAAATAAEVLAAIEWDLKGMAHPGQFITALCALLGPRRGELSFSSAGHPRPLRLSADGVRSVAGDGDVPLLVEPGESRRRESTLTIAPGERLLVYTDGAIEAADPSGRIVGVEGLMRIAAEAMAARDQDEALLVRVTERILSFTGRRLQDDVAMLTIEAT
jgi:serine phosphatase RsbU (regulator of sigma subunit)